MSTAKNTKAKSKKSENLIQCNTSNLNVIEKENNEITKNLQDELNTNPEFSLNVDPTNKYSMTDEQKKFIKNFCEFKSIPMAAELSGISLDEAKSYYVAYSSQQEIRRINRAMYQRQFSSKLLTIDEISRWLSALIVDDNVPIANRVKTMDKVRIAQMLIDLQLYKNEGINNPSTLMNADIETEIKELSVKSIKTLLKQKDIKDKDDSKNQIVEEVKSKQELSPEEEVFLKTLPTKDILQLLDNSNKKENKK